MVALRRERALFLVLTADDLDLHTLRPTTVLVVLPLTAHTSLLMCLANVKRPR